MARADKAAEIADRVALTVALDARTKQVRRLEEALRAAREGNATTTTADSAEASEKAANVSGPPTTTSAPKGTAARIAAKMRRRRGALEPSAGSVEGTSTRPATLPALAPRVPSSVPSSPPLSVPAPVSVDVAPLRDHRPRELDLAQSRRLAVFDRFH